MPKSAKKTAKPGASGPGGRDGNPVEKEFIRLASLSEKSPIVIMASDERGTISYLNPAGWRAFPDLTASKTRHPVLAGLRGVVAEMHRKKSLTHARRVNFRKSWYEQVFRHIPGEHRLLIYLTDITAVKVAEEALAESEKRFRALAENQHDLLYSLDRHGRYDYVSPNVEKYGWTAAEIIGKHFLDLVHPDDRKMLADRYEAVLKGAIEKPGPARFFDKAGNVVWLDMLTRLKTDSAGRPVGGTGVARDITDRVEVENRLRQRLEREAYLARLSSLFTESESVAAHEHLCRSLEGLPAVMNARSVALALGGETGSVRLIQFGGGEKGGGSCLDMELKDEQVSEIRRAMAGGSAVTAVSSLAELSAAARRQVEALGRRDDMALLVAPFVVKGNRLGCVCAVAEEGRAWAGDDIALLKLVASIFANALSRLEASERVAELDRLRNKFIHIVSRQLRTPLNAIRWNLEALLKEEMGKLKASQKSFVKVVYDAEVDIIKRINDIATAIDIEQGRVSFERDEFSLESLWNGVLEEISKAADIKGIALQYSPPREALPTVVGDPEKVREVMGILVGNAVTYTPEGGRISVVVAARDRRVRFSVSDNGIGVPESDQPRIFERFCRATNASTMKADASGLGLSIAKYYIEEQGGSIGFQSREGRGSTFWFEMPVR